MSLAMAKRHLACRLPGARLLCATNCADEPNRQLHRLEGGNLWPSFGHQASKQNLGLAVDTFFFFFLGGGKCHARDLS